MMRLKQNYNYSDSQVNTPAPVISLFWRLIKRYRHRLGTVLDMGAGDSRFALGGHFDRYIGVEIDRKRASSAKLPPNGEILKGCVFQHKGRGYDACIGNPPYVRHHFIRSPWKEQTVMALEREMGVSLDKHCNLYVYFLCLGLLKTHEEGLLCLVVPYEWVGRPSARGLRDYIQEQGWNVSVYRFRMPIFDGVLTTASITIVDKARRDARWRYFDVLNDYRVVKRKGVTDSKNGVLNYEERGKIWTLRGLSPGSQKVFTLTEGERVRVGLSKRDVTPCVTSLRKVPRSLKLLSRKAFDEYFVRAGEKCWLIRSNESKRSNALNAYLKAVPPKDRNTYTCQNQTPWFNYLPHPAPRMLFSSGFTKFGPKVLINSVGAHAVGSVWGIHSKERLSVRRLQGRLLRTNFEKQVVAHAKTLKKVEVKQLNAVLNSFVGRERKNGRKGTR